MKISKKISATIISWIGILSLWILYYAEKGIHGNEVIFFGIIISSIFSYLIYHMTPNDALNAQSELNTNKNSKTNKK